ncbi:MAG: hypothetical protein LC731_01275 [Acidobacteria bacterium]|nr:hypothetical protein [Acidobacteriota bacterium]
MDNLDRLGWAAGISFKSYGVQVGIRTNDAGLLDSLTERLPPGWRASRSMVVDRLYSVYISGRAERTKVRRYNLLYGDLERLVRSLDAEHVYDALETDLQLYVAERAPRRSFIHAGAVGWRGRAVIMPGRSFSGKTTLARELIARGATFYSDEYAVLDRHGRVHPFPRALQIRENGAGRQTKYTIESLGGRSGVKPLPVGLVLLSEYRTGARWQPRRLTAGQGMLAVMQHSVSARLRPETVLETLQQVVTRAPVLKSARGEASEIADKVLAILDSGF